MQPSRLSVASHLVRGGQYAQDNAMDFNLFGGRHHGGLFLSSPATVLAQRFRGGVVYVEPVPVYGPFFPYAYPYPYGYYAAGNYGYVKVNTHGQNADVYVDEIG